MSIANFSEMRGLMDSLRDVARWNPPRRRLRVLQIKEVLEEFLYEVAGTSAGRISNVVEIPHKDKPLYDHALKLRKLLEDMASLKIATDEYAKDLAKAQTELKEIFALKKEHPKDELLPHPASIPKVTRGDTPVPVPSSTFQPVKVPGES